MGGLVFADLSVSLDGFVTGPGASLEQPLGAGGERLHQWLYDLSTWRDRHGMEGGRSDQDAALLDEAFSRGGAYVMGRRMFDHAVQAWGNEPPFRAPVFVVTHSPRPELVRTGGTTFTFVTEGVGEAVSRARRAAGGRDVSVAGGADVVRQALSEGLLDELQLHLVPVLLGGGVRLFEETGPGPVEMPATRVVVSPGVTHIRLRPA